MTRILIIRFSSIGDIIQSMGVVDGLKRRFPQAQIEWVTREDMSQIVEINGQIDRVWRLDKKGGFAALIKLCRILRAEHFDYIYDAHNNLRSSILKLFLYTFSINRPRWVVRGKERWKRWLLFALRINKFNWPFIGVDSFRKPLSVWGVDDFSAYNTQWRFSQESKAKFEQLINQRTITLIPSANWEMKRWPVAHWQRLVSLLPDYNFVILAGPTDNFCSSIEEVAPQRVVNLAGRSSLLESCYITSISNIVVSADTGFLHAADLFSVKSIAMIGPTAFGFPMKEHTSTLMEIDMKCRPCSKDGRRGCTQSIYQQCMVDITPEMVAKKVEGIFNTK